MKHVHLFISLLFHIQSLLCDCFPNSLSIYICIYRERNWKIQYTFFFYFRLRVLFCRHYSSYRVCSARDLLNIMRKTYNPHLMLLVVIAKNPAPRGPAGLTASAARVDFFCRRIFAVGLAYLPLAYFYRLHL